MEGFTDILGVAWFFCPFTGFKSWHESVESLESTVGSSISRVITTRVPHLFSAIKNGAVYNSIYNLVGAHLV